MIFSYIKIHRLMIKDTKTQMTHANTSCFSIYNNSVIQNKFSLFPSTPVELSDFAELINLT